MQPNFKNSIPNCGNPWNNCCTIRLKLLGQNYRYHASQEDSQNGAESQVVEHLHLGAATNSKLKPILKFYKPVPQLKIVQGSAPQGAELMSRLEFKTISFKAGGKKSGGSAKQKTTLTAVASTLESYKGGRRWGRQRWEASSHKEWLVTMIHQPLAGQCWVERRHRVPEPWSCTGLDKQLGRRLLWWKGLSPHLARAQHLKKRYSHRAWECCLHFPYARSKLSSVDPCCNPETWEASTSQTRSRFTHAWSHGLS